MPCRASQGHPDPWFNLKVNFQRHRCLSQSILAPLSDVEDYWQLLIHLAALTVLLRGCESFLGRSYSEKLRITTLVLKVHVDVKWSHSDICRIATSDNCCWINSTSLWYWDGAITPLGVLPLEHPTNVGSTLHGSHCDKCHIATLVLKLVPSNKLTQSL